MLSKDALHFHVLINIYNYKFPSVLVLVFFLTEKKKNQSETHKLLGIFEYGFWIFFGLNHKIFKRKKQSLHQKKFKNYTVA